MITSLYNFQSMFSLILTRCPYSNWKEIFCVKMKMTDTIKLGVLKMIHQYKADRIISQSKHGSFTLGKIKWLIRLDLCFLHRCAIKTVKRYIWVWNLCQLWKLHILYWQWMVVQLSGEKPNFHLYALTPPSIVSQKHPAILMTSTCECRYGG